MSSQTENRQHLEFGRTDPKMLEFTRRSSYSLVQIMQFHVPTGPGVPQ